MFHRSPREGGVEWVLRNPTPVGEPLIALVHTARKRWLQVYLPTRPNGARGWVTTRSVKLLTTAFSLAVHLRSHRLILLHGQRTARVFPIGVGRAVTPTPTGTYFINELLKQPNPHGLYGPYAFGLSAYSGVLKHFGRGGNGQIGIHGTDHPSLVGTDVSHGCIRLRNPDILWLVKRLPLGTPVRISHT
jgi:lipoprotein-anchoring transpeptidase ErfK/SrfK